MKLDRLLKIARKILLALRYRRHIAALLQHGVLAGIEHRSVFSPDLCSIVDIGANRGQFALAARAVVPRATIISFEPQERPAGVYQAVFADDVLTTLHQVAIGPSVETKRMHVSARDDSSSLLAISEIQRDNFPGTEEVGTTEVMMAPLDHYLSRSMLTRPALLKLDVQGFEYEALLGCESLLDCFDQIYCECSFVELYQGQRMASEIIDWLLSRGFELCGLYNLLFDKDGRTLQADCLFRHRAQSLQAAVPKKWPS
jgi:FkbM family methyltransferase